ncbi:MAG: circadian clock protein KaiC [Prolixibacteraceae bacterium]
MTIRKLNDVIEKMKTGIEGLDSISNGGLPRNRSTLIAGSSGSAKTVLAIQFLAEGIKQFNENGVFVTFEETPEDIRKNMWSLGWDLQKWEDEKKFAFVDASPQPGEGFIVSGDYDLGALLARIEHAINKVNGVRVAIDSVSAIFTQLQDTTIIRRELYRVTFALKQMKMTSVMTAERLAEYGEVARFGVEEFVSDNVIILRNVLDSEKRRRTLEILKFRGATHQKGEYPFTVIPGEGMVVIPLSEIELKQKSSTKRIHTGNEVLDKITAGGYFRDSIILVSGATGNGKTLMVTEFIYGGVTKGEKCLLFAYEESKEQLYRNASGWNMDFDKLEAEGKLKVVCVYPETMGLEDHFIKMRKIIDEFKPNRIAVDSLSALERVSTEKGYREFVIGITSFIKDREACGLFTSTTPTLLGGTSITEAHISTITDTIILLRYVEMMGEMRRGLTVLKMRGSTHEKNIFEFTIDGHGMHVGKPFRNISGILSGTVQHFSPSEVDRISGLFKD